MQISPNKNQYGTEKPKQLNADLTYNLILEGKSKLSKCKFGINVRDKQNHVGKVILKYKFYLWCYKAYLTIVSKRVLLILLF